ncbi:hypothetical protein HZA55_06860 [Candidatus Poribacteria bacterium]|nr:hypothetical protein [Candidatus Poribacteria bacterium]
MKKACSCPYCEEELILSCMEPVFCKHCKVKLIKCENCQKLYNGNLKNCPECGKK